MEVIVNWFPTLGSIKSGNLEMNVFISMKYLLTMRSKSSMISDESFHFYEIFINKKKLYAFNYAMRILKNFTVSYT